MTRGISRRSFRRLAQRGVALGVVVTVVSQLVISLAASDHIVADPSQLNNAPVVIVPGTLVLADGTPSRMLQARIESAVGLYHDGTVNHILVSGDNSTIEYNEPVAMRDHAVALGVPASDITLDYAGTDTWDTCLRANEQFGVTTAVFVTQLTFAERAAALCQAAGIDVSVLALTPPDLPSVARMVGGLRESFARVKATGDVIRQPGAKFGGPFVGLVGSTNMPPNGHPPDWNWTTNQPG